MSRRRGINAFEVIVVIVVIGIVVALLWPVYQGFGERSQEAARKAGVVDRSVSVRDTGALINDATVAGAEATPPAAKALAGERKIIYDSELTLVVEDIAGTETEITKLIKD